MTDADAWDDPDRAVQIEDDNAESLAGAEVEFDPDDDETDDNDPAEPLCIHPSADAEAANLPNEVP
jgi:hypothetical protein